MIRACRAADWARAGERLGWCRTRTDGLPLAKLYDIYAERLAGHRTILDIDQWDGVYEAQQK